MEDTVFITRITVLGTETNPRRGKTGQWYFTPHLMISQSLHMLNRPNYNPEQIHVFDRILV